MEIDFLSIVDVPNLVTITKPLEIIRLAIEQLKFCPEDQFEWFAYIDHEHDLRGYKVINEELYFLYCPIESWFDGDCTTVQDMQNIIELINYGNGEMALFYL